MFKGVKLDFEAEFVLEIKLSFYDFGVKIEGMDLAENQNFILHKG